MDGGFPVTAGGAGHTNQASATINPGNRTIKWSIIDPKLGCTIDDQGKITAGTQAGQITVRAADLSLGDACKADAMLAVVHVKAINIAQLAQVERSSIKMW